MYSTPSARNWSHTALFQSSFEKTVHGTDRRFARSITPAFGLLQYILTTCISELAKFFTKFSALVPDPEAKIAIFDIKTVNKTLITFTPQKYKYLSFNAKSFSNIKDYCFFLFCIKKKDFICSENGINN